MLKIHRNIQGVEDVVNPKVEYEVQSIRVREERPAEEPKAASQKKEAAKGGKKTSKKRV